MGILVSGPAVINHILFLDGRNKMQHREFRAHRCSGIVNRTSKHAHENILNLNIAGFNGRFPASPRCRSARSLALGDQLRESTKIEVRKNNEDIDTALGSSSHDLPRWLVAFSENSMGEEASASSDPPASIPREPPHQELSRRVVSGMHSIFTHFQKDGNWDVCKRTIQGPLMEDAQIIQCQWSCLEEIKFVEDQFGTICTRRRV